jgi:APA family basic amino acid/polyamine antiporter
MIGVSLFVLPESLYIYGYYSWIGWIVCSACVFSLALVFGDLAKKFPNGGGPYEYTRRLCGSRVGYVVGAMHLASIVIQTGSILHAMQEHLSRLVYPLVNIDRSICVALCTILPLLVVTLVNSRDFETSSGNIVILNMIKYIPLALLIFFGLNLLNAESLMANPGRSAATSICGSVSLIMYAFAGIEFGVMPDTSRMKDPARVIPRALLLGTGVTVIVFVALQAIVWSVCTPQEMYCAVSGIPIPQLAERVIGPAGYMLTLGLGALFAYTALNTSLFVTSHLLAMMCGKGYKPTRMIWSASLLSAAVTVFLFGGLRGYDSAFNLIIVGSDFLLALVFLATMYAHNSSSEGGVLRARLALISAALLVAISGAGLVALA